MASTRAATRRVEVRLPMAKKAMRDMAAEDTEDAVVATVAVEATAGATMAKGDTGVLVRPVRAAKSGDAVAQMGNIPAVGRAPGSLERTGHDRAHHVVAAPWIQTLIRPLDERVS